ncbi:MAG: 4-hydroxybutyrate CoA-transferase, partial [Planctomycetales bacterium 12-60-4]
MTVHSVTGIAPDEVMQTLRSGMRVFVHGAAATPTPLLEALVRRTELHDVRLYHMHLEGAIPFASPEFSERFRSVSLFTGAALREPIASGRADFIPVFLSDIPGLFRDRVIPLDAALIQVSPPDRHGYCTLGTSCDTARAAVDAAPIVLAEINTQMPRTHGATAVPLSRLTAFTVTDRPLPQHPRADESAVEARIGELIAAMIEDRSTLQLGIGAIPDAVARRLMNKHDLGVHTEMFSDGVVDLAEAGVITNRFKSIHPGRIVTSFISGSQRVYDFVNANPLVEFHPSDRTKDTGLIRKLERVIAINSA